MANKFHVLDYNNLNEAGLRPLMTAIKSVGGDVIKLEPAGAARRKDGVATKSFRLINDDGQIIELQVNESGDLSGAKLNGKVYPAGSPANLHDMALKITTAFTTNAAVYANSLAKKLARAARAEVEKGTKRGVKSNAQRLQELKGQAATYQGNIDSLNGKINAAQQLLNTVQTSNESLTQSLRNEQAKQRQLKQEISSLEKQINEYA
ncbi:hypothetical protein NLN92_14340 [Citrobacter portucalensis]|uniref:defense against restriction DarA-related protein n=1 Tax=Citrobacter portucalensis TaxID=1639133 RepID=UPI00226B885A|nr:hypothetical protein [Citrobacter portucalensis]MCX8979188.1 hypothetical protein [Citrobacter portucalensis]